MHAAKLTRKAALYTSDRTKLKRLLTPATSVKTNFVEEKMASFLPEATKLVAEVAAEPVINIEPVKVDEEAAEVLEPISKVETPAAEIIETITPSPAET